MVPLIWKYIGNLLEKHSSHIEKSPFVTLGSRRGSNLCTILFSKELTNYVLLFFSVFFSAGGAGWHEQPMAQ